VRKIGSFADAAKFGEVIVLAVKGTVALDALKAAGAPNIAGKPVMDATNPIADAPPANGVLKFFTDMNLSLMERPQSAFPDAHFVKAFNSVGNALPEQDRAAAQSTPAQDLGIRNPCR
jgi:8-hydroxy-5-deazaflavin:NADPH oxidoreductase